MKSPKQDRRSVILDTVILLLAEKGLAGITHRATDAAAGLPQGSTSYYFPKKSDLLRAAALHLALELEKDCDRLQVGFAGVVAKDGLDKAINYVAGELIDTIDEAKHLMLARIELTLAAARDEELSDIGERLLVAGKRPIEFFISLISGGKNDVPIDTYVGMIDGITLMYANGQNSQPAKDQVAVVIRSLIAGV
ncbi:TetR/AcrR family transcriptional regulator [Kordiimonas pumila]|uniref:TetR/AcrR family transcriptional regulator n=1 Tax=Kordiimonas pumila TaxID=2161677 RepID=A0ABV7DAS3_9PROT|nr:TetR family transcriptional regulator [Kordiimonas pumila]